MLSTDSAAACPCGTGASYEACCGALHRGAAARSAEGLMRARYSAYTQKDADYILRTWHPRTRPRAMTLAEDGLTWTGLTVHEHRVTGKNKATVRFSATYSGPDGVSVTLHEKSRFVREDGAWLYLDGQ